MLKQHRSMLNWLAFKCWRMNKRQAELQDFRAVADVAAWRAWERYDASLGLRLKWWIHTKVNGALLDYARVMYGGRSKGSEAHVRTASVARVDELENLLPAPPDSDPAVTFEVARRAARVRAAIDELLTEGQADVLRLIYFGGLSQAEVSRRRNCTQSNVQFLRERAIERLRREFIAE